MRYILLSLFFVCCAACSVTRQAAPSENISTEVKVVTVYEKDTVVVEIPQIVEKVQTMDTVSVLENEFAKSSAEISKGIRRRLSIKTALYSEIERLWRLLRLRSLYRDGSSSRL